MLVVQSYLETEAWVLETCDFFPIAQKCDHRRNYLYWYLSCVTLLFVILKASTKPSLTLPPPSPPLPSPQGEKQTLLQ